MEQASTTFNRELAKLGLNTAKTKAEEHFLNATRLLQAELYQAAVVEFHQACLLGKERILPLAKTLFHQINASGDKESALSIGMLVLSLEVNDYDLAYQLGLIAHQVGNDKQAVSLFKQALLVKPDFFPALIYLGTAQEEVPLYGQAPIQAYNSYAETECIYPAFLNRSQGEGYFLIPDYLQQIKPILLKAMQEEIQSHLAAQGQAEQNEAVGNPKKSLAHLKLGSSDEDSASLNNGNHGLVMEYAEYFQLQKEQEPHNESLWDFNLCLFKLQKKTDLATLPSEIQKLQKKEPSLPYIEVLYALALSANKQTEKAIEILLGLVNKNRFNRLANVNLGLLYRKQHNILNAAKYLVWAYYLVKRSDGHYFIEQFLMEANNKFDALAFREAEKKYALLIEEKWPDVQVHLRYLESLERLVSPFVKILEVIKRSTLLFPNDPRLRITIAEIYENFVSKGDSFFAEKKFGRALSFYKDALLLDRRITLQKKILETYELIELSEDERMEYEELKKTMHQFLKAEKPALSAQEKNRRAILDEKWKGQIQSALEMIRAQNFRGAVPVLESAFHLKPNQETFDLLSNTYRVLNKNEELVILLEKFKRIQLYEKKLFQNS